MDFAEEIKDKFNFIKAFISLSEDDHDDDFPLEISLYFNMDDILLEKITEIYSFHINKYGYLAFSIFNKDIKQELIPFIINLHYIIISNLSTNDIENVNLFKDNIESLKKSIEISHAFWGGKTNTQLTNSVEQWHPDFKTQ